MLCKRMTWWSLERRACCHNSCSCCKEEFGEANYHCCHCTHLGWGPLPIVFVRDSDMETRYGLLRGTLRAPAVGWMMYNVLVSNEKSIQSQYKSLVYADAKNVTPGIIESRYELTKRKGARYVPAAFLTGLLDSVKSCEEFIELFAGLEGRLPVLIMLTSGAPKRSKAEMEALREAKGVI